MIERVNAGAVGSAPPIEQPNQTRGLQGFVRDALETIAAQLRRLGGVRLDPTRVEAAAPEAVRAEEDRRVLVSSKDPVGRIGIFLQYLGSGKTIIVSSFVLLLLSIATLTNQKLYSVKNY